GEHFDAEGWFCSGDALKFIDPAQPQLGLQFDGRIAEDFKLATGTWVAVGPLRAAFIDHCAPLVQDVVIAGIDRDEVAALVVLEANACRAVAARAQADLADLARDPAVRAALRERVGSFAAKATGSSNRIARAILLEEAPSIDRGELTDKGSINQRALLANRSDLVERLYASGDALVLRSG
ncbi:MAG: feruloyl-CoA synthase, partial [Burkholderiales bacterium]|nr:feruloyl-CoA synthase [Burkholderiales bacterium]